MRSAIGIDIGGTKIRAAWVSESGEILAESVQPTATPALAVVSQIEAMAGALHAPARAALGIGVPGRVDAAAGIVLSGGIVDLAGITLRWGDRPAFIDNDANMALLAEARLGAAKGLAHAVMLTIGTGIGGAVLDQGRILRGRAAAGQLGHITVDLNGGLCLCGRRGCVETASSGTALGRLMAAAGLPSSTEAGELVERGDAVSRAVIEAWARPLRAAIDNLVAAFDPQCVILGGGLGRAACAALARFPSAASWFQCPVIPATLGGSAGVIGAALIALEQAA